VSTLAQMGIVAARVDACLGLPGVSSKQLDSGALELDISDSMLPVVARCSMQTCVG